MSWSSLLHLNRNGEHIKRASCKKLLRDITEVLRTHIVDVRFNHDDFARACNCGLRAFLAHHQTQAIWKIRKLLGSGPVSNSLRNKSSQVSELVHDAREDRSACRRDKFRLYMLLIDRGMPQEFRGRRRRYGKDAVLAMDESAADVYGRAH